MNLQEQFDNYVKATEISVGKILGREPMKFKEYLFTGDGIKREVIHEALPVTIENQDKLYALLDELENAQTEIENALVSKQQEFIELTVMVPKPKTKTSINPETGDSIEEIVPETEKEKEARIKKEKEITVKLSQLTKEIKKIGRELERKVIDIRSDIAVLLFSRTSQGMTRDRVKKFMDKDQLSIIDYIAKGLTIPPRQLPGSEMRT